MVLTVLLLVVVSESSAFETLVLSVLQPWHLVLKRKANESVTAILRKEIRSSSNVIERYFCDTFGIIRRDNYLCIKDLGGLDLFRLVLKLGLSSMTSFSLVLVLFASNLRRVCFKFKLLLLCVSDSFVRTP